MIFMSNWINKYYTLNFQKNTLEYTRFKWPLLKYVISVCQLSQLREKKEDVVSKFPPPHVLQSVLLPIFNGTIEHWSDFSLYDSLVVNKVVPTYHQIFQLLELYMTNCNCYISAYEALRKRYQNNCVLISMNHPKIRSFIIVHSVSREG